MRVDESLNSHSCLTANSHTLSLTIERSHQPWKCYNFDWNWWEFKLSISFYRRLPFTFIDYWVLSSTLKYWWQVNESSNRHSRLTANSRPLSLTLSMFKMLMRAGLWELKLSPSCSLTDSRMLSSTLNMFKISMRVVESLIHRPCFTAHSRALSLTLERSCQLWTCSKFRWRLLRV